VGLSVTYYEVMPAPSSRSQSLTEIGVCVYALWLIRAFYDAGSARKHGR